MIRIAGKIAEIIPDLLKLDMNKTFICEIKEPKSKRSLEQNRMLWKLIHTIAKKTHQDDMDVYCGCLERADALSDYIITASVIEEDLRKCFRGVKFMRTANVNGKDCNIYKVYLGSSKMDVKEMTELIDICFQVCGELGISPMEYEYE